ALMFAMKGLGGSGGLPGNRKLVALSLITKVGGADQVRARQIFSRTPLQAHKFALKIGSVQRSGGIVAHPAGEQHSQSGKCAGMLGDQHGSNAQLLGDFTGVQSAATTEGDER